MTEQFATVFVRVVGERNRATPTGQDLATFLAIYLRGVASSVQEDYGLFFPLLNYFERRETPLTYRSKVA